jgi:hypothetical protein
LGKQKEMVVPAIVDMLLLLVGFLTGLRWKSPGDNRGITGDSAASQARIEQLTEVVQKG